RLLRRGRQRRKRYATTPPIASAHGNVRVAGEGPTRHAQPSGSSEPASGAATGGSPIVPGGMAPLGLGAAGSAVEVAAGVGDGVLPPGSGLTAAGGVPGGGTTPSIPGASSGVSARIATPSTMPKFEL